MADTDFYPRSPCGERRCEKGFPKYAYYFYPRSPCGERQLANVRNSPNNQISIHALLAESDKHNPAWGLPDYDFYPRSPCGERPIKGKPAKPVVGISIHALLAESDFKCSLGNPRKKPYFYPRSPCGERLRRSLSVQGHKNHFYPRSPCGERR